MSIVDEVVPRLYSHHYYSINKPRRGIARQRCVAAPSLHTQSQAEAADSHLDRGLMIARVGLPPDIFSNQPPPESMELRDTAWSLPVPVKSVIGAISSSSSRSKQSTNQKSLSRQVCVNEHMRAHHQDGRVSACLLVAWRAAVP